MLATFAIRGVILALAAKDCQKAAADRKGSQDMIAEVVESPSPTVALVTVPSDNAGGARLDRPATRHH